MSEQIIDAERQLLVVLITKAWVEIKDDKDMDAASQELLDILRKISGVDKRLTVEGVR